MSKAQWINPEEKLPEQKQEVLFKTVVLHTKKIRHGRYRDEEFVSSEVAGGSHDKSDIWGWLPFEDSDKKVGTVEE